VSVGPAQQVSCVSEIAVAGDGQIMEREAPTFDEGIFFEKLSRERVWWGGDESKGPGC
jgi:hypothetical protein